MNRKRPYQNRHTSLHRTLSTAQLVAGVMAIAWAPSAFGAKLAGWDFTGYSGYGASPQAPTTTGAGVTIGGLTRGSTLTTTPTAAANAWGANGWNVTPSDFTTALASSKYATFSITPSTAAASFQSIDPYNIRHSGSGPATGQWQYQVGAGAFTDIGSSVSWGTNTTGTGNAMTAIDLSGIAALQNVPVGTTVTFRVVNWGGITTPAASGTWYFNNFQDGDDLIINGTLAGGDTTPPQISTLSPADGATDFDGTGYTKLTMVFNEPITLATGTILLKAGSTVVDSFDVTNFDDVDFNGISTLGLILTNPLADNTAYHIEIPSGAIKDTATVPNTYAGFSDSTTWNFTTAPAPTAPTVAVNKYLNGSSASGDIIELLAIGSGTPGTTVNMGGMIVKDFSGDAIVDNGGKYEFKTGTIWDSVPVGTLVVLENNNTAADIDSSDFVLRVGLQNTTYFTGLGGGIDIANNEMILIKEAGSGAAGTTGGIHALGGGIVGPFFNLFPKAKVLASVGTSGVVVTNPTSTVADFIEGTNALGGVALTSGSFGTFNNPDNRTYILNLRGINPTNGDGSATLVNVTAGSPLNGSPVFSRGLSGQSTAITINSSDPSVTLAKVKVTVPAAFGTPGTVTLSGSGSTGASSSTSGQVITISNAAATNTAPLVVTISGLSNPTPSLITDNGNYSFGIETSTASGTPSAIGAAPVAYVTVPIEALRDVTVAGIPLDLTSVVAVEGVVTEADFGSGGGNYSGYLQDSTAGINIFAATFDPGLVRDNRFIVLGTVTLFDSVTEIVASSASNIFNLGAATPVAPQVITLATLLANPEKYEGSLVTVQNLNFVSGAWTPGTNLVLSDSTATNITVRVQAGSTATPTYAAPIYPMNVTGVVGQFDQSNPFTTGYQLLPRDPADLAAGSASDYDIWAGSPTGGTGGPTADPDGDGKDNAFEYAFGLSASSGASVNPFAVPLNPATAKFRYTRRLQAQTGLTYKVFTSPTLLAGSWVQDSAATQTVVGTSAEVETVEVTLSSPAPLTASRLFLRVVAE